MKYIVSVGAVQEIDEKDVFTNEEGKTFIKETCPRCHGIKIFQPWMHTYGGKCFKCDGLGTIDVRRTVYTSIESAQKVADKYDKQVEKKRHEEFLKREENIVKNNERERQEYGFINDSLYIVFCKYEEKDIVKNLGAKWNSKLHFWTVQEPIQEFECLKIEWQQVTEECEVWEDIEVKSINFDNSKFYEIIEEYKNSKKTYEGEFVGAEKDKLELNVTLKKITGYSTEYGWTNIYIFKDTNNNTLTWKTTKEMEWEEGQELTIKATVKAHIEFENERDNKIEKQTSILRVKEV